MSRSPYECSRASDLYFVMRDLIETAYEDGCNQTCSSGRAYAQMATPPIPLTEPKVEWIRRDGSTWRVTATRQGVYSAHRDHDLMNDHVDLQGLLGMLALDLPSSDVLQRLVALPTVPRVVRTHQLVLSLLDKATDTELREEYARRNLIPDAVDATVAALQKELGMWLSSAENDADQLQAQGTWGATRAAAIRRDIARAEALL